MSEEVVYVGGDSFTSAEDIADYLIEGHCFHSTNDFRSALTDIEKLTENNNNWVNTRIAHCNKYGAAMLDNEAKTYRWSAQLEKILNKKVMNISGLGGSSIYAICYRAVYDIVELNSKGYKVTDAVIQLTNSPRFSFFTEEKVNVPDEHQKYKIKSFTLNSIEDIRLRNEFAKLEAYDMSIYRSFYDIYTTDMMITNLIGKRPVFVDSLFYRHSELAQVTPFEKFHKFEKESNFLTDYVKSLEQRVAVSMRDCVENDDEKVWTTNYHFDKTIHERFAKKIAEIYFK